MAKKENKEAKKKALKINFAQNKVLTALFLMLSCLFGVMLGIIIMLSFYPTQLVGEKQPSAEAPSIKPSGEATGMVCMEPLSKDKVREKVRKFLYETYDSYLKSINVELKDLKINKVESYDDCLYSIEAEVTTDQGKLPSSPIYATKDGKKIIFGPIYDLNEPLKFEKPKEPAKEYPKSDRPKVLMFVMSFCPFGQQAEKGLKPAVELLGDKIDFEPHYVIYSGKYGYTYPDYCIDENANYCSMHGIAELREDVRQLCIWKYEPDKFWPYVEKIYQGNCNLNNIDTCWKEQAEAVGIDVAKIEECFNNEAIALLEKEVELNEKYGVRGSPTIFINDVEYSGNRSPESFKKAICSAFKEAPEECSEELSSETGAGSGQC